MPKTLKLKIDGAVSSGELFKDVEELELECDGIADGAFPRNNRRSSAEASRKRIDPRCSL